MPKPISSTSGASRPKAARASKGRSLSKGSSRRGPYCS